MYVKNEVGYVWWMWYVCSKLSFIFIDSCLKKNIYR